ncbi:MAG: hypothetical protein GXO55_06075 [Chloroflexi bacterium]|nr:hypothetical protein [Chloroflexota bacterium]
MERLKIKVDEDLPRAAVVLLQEHGYDAVGVHEQGMSGWKDHVLWRAVQEEGRFLVTADKGFGDVRVYPPGTHHGVLLLRPGTQGIRPVLDLLQRFLALYRFDDVRGCVVVVTPRGVRIRCP